MSNNLKVRCTGCSKVLSVPRSLIGKIVKCPACQTRLEIEASQAEDVPEATRRPAPPPPFDPELASQPTHASELGRDRKRIVSAVSTEPDKYEVVQPYLMSYETPVAIAVQRKFPFSLFADIVLLSSHRLLCFKRFFTKIDMFDVNYVDIQNVTVRQGFFTTALTVKKAGGTSFTIKGLVTDQALDVYRRCQDIETKARMTRRQFQLEENRSRTTQMQINNVSGVVPPSGNVRLEQGGVARIGDEQTNPFLLGE
jgi:phage FluMu protein Com